MPPEIINNGLLERELHNITLKLNEVNSTNTNEVLIALLSGFLTLFMSYFSKIGVENLLNLWGFSFGTVFFLWELEGYLKQKQNKSSSNRSDNNARSIQTDNYHWELIGKSVYSGVKAFGVLSAISLVIYLGAFITKRTILEPGLLIFLGILATVSTWDEQRLISSFAKFGKMSNRLSHHYINSRDKIQGLFMEKEETVDLNTIIGIFLGVGSIIFLVIESILAPIKLIKYSSNLGLWIPILLVSFQYMLVWSLMCAINKNQIHRDLVNALICLQNLQYKLLSNNVTMERVASCVKYTHFLKLTPLMVLEFYFYIPHPIHEQILASSEEISESETN